MMQFHVSDAIHLLFFTYLVLFQIPSIRVNAYHHDCYDLQSQNYTSGDKFETNLKRLFNSFYTKGPPTRFNTTISGDTPDRVYGLVQCDPTSSEEECRNCVNGSTIEIVRLCHNTKQAVLLYNICYLRYSDLPFFSQLDPLTRFYYAWPNRDASDPVLFKQKLGALMDNLSSTTPSNLIKYATGTTKFTDFEKIYGLLQCTRDLSATDCRSCLQQIISHIPKCCDGRAGGNVLTVRCNLRYETYPFFKYIPPPPPSPLEASPPPPQIEGDQDTNTTIKTEGDGNRNNSKIVLSVAVPVVAGIVLVSVVFTCLLWRNAVKKDDDDGDLEDAGITDHSPLINLSMLKVATSNFSNANKLGEGGFGSVYKGKLPDGHEIAVKRLSKRSTQGLEELRTEVLLLAKLQHRNLVQLCGCCLEEQEMLLIYDYLPNSSLDRFLFDRIKRLQLDWETRHMIIIGIARGLLYLHEDSQLRIIHRDLKASNILLDGDMNPKISDFGLARLFNEDQTRGRTNRIAGTFGYISPEYATHGHFSTKSDVFSFGVLVLEIVTGRKNSSFRDSERATNLLSFAWEHWTNGRAIELLDKTVRRPCSRSEVLECIHIGLLCVQENAMDRPTMSAVVLMLNSYSVTLPSPSRPAFILRSTTEPPRNSEASESDQTTTNSKMQSVNDVTITELEPR